MQLEESLGIAQAKYGLGRIRNEQAQDEQALALFTASKEIFAEEADWLGVAKNLNLMAVCHLKRYRELQTAQTLLEESIALQRRLPLTATFVETLRNLARVEARVGAYAAAECSLNEALTVSRQQQDRGEYAAVLFEQLLLCKKRGQVDAALAYGYEALESFRQMGSLRWEALIKTQLGLLHQSRGQFAQALGLVTEGLQIFGELGDHYEQAYSYFYLYKLYGERGEAEQSANAKAQALRLNQALNDQQLAARLA
jgi:tetratricopeptide (TPR) repeat protein